MEKAVVFGPMIIFLVVFLLLIAGFVGLMVKFILRSKGESWEGEVIEKKVTEIEDDDGNSRDYYYLVVKLTDGREKRVGMSQTQCLKFEVGDKIKKVAGKLWPEKM